MCAVLFGLAWQGDFLSIQNINLMSNIKRIIIMPVKGDPKRLSIVTEVDSSEAPVVAEIKEILARSYHVVVNAIPIHEYYKADIFVQNNSFLRSCNRHCKTKSLILLI
jgi:hypothetical protein